MKHAIYSLDGQFLGSYEGERDESSRFRSHLLCPPHAIHLPVPEGLDEDCLEVYEVESIPAQDGAPDIWVKGEELLIEPPADLTGWTFIPGKSPVEGVIGGLQVRESQSLKQAKIKRKAELVLADIRAARAELLNKADIEIFKLEDAGQDSSSWRSYRAALRSCTDNLKESDGSVKLSCADLIASEFVFPNKP